MVDGIQQKHIVYNIVHDGNNGLLVKLYKCNYNYDHIFDTYTKISSFSLGEIKSIHNNEPFYNDK